MIKEGKGCLAVPPDTWVCFRTGTLHLPKGCCLPENYSQRASREEAKAAPAPGVPRARALGSREASPRSSVCRAHHSGREAPGLSGFPHPCLAHESRDFKTTGGVVPLIFDPWVSCSLLPFPYIFLCCHFKPQKVVYRFPQKHNPISLSASYVVRPVSGSFSRSF